jgi:hypothetical protein
MNAVLYPACAAITLLATLIRLPALRRDRSPAQVALTVNFALLCIIWTISTPPIWTAISKFAGVPNLSGLLSQGAAILLVMCVQILVLHWAHERATAWRKAIPRLIILALVLIAMIILFFVAVDHGENPNDFAVTKARHFPVYLAVYITAYFIVQIDIFRLCWSFSKKAPEAWLRRGLQIAALGCFLSWAYCVGRIADIVAGQFGISGDPWEPVVQIAVVSSAIVRLIGWTIPSWGHYLSDVWSWFDRLRALRQLSPLHEAILAAIPNVSLSLEHGTPIATRLYRVLIELRDGQRALQPWMDPAVVDAAQRHSAAAGLTEQETAAIVEAAQLRAALQDHQADHAQQAPPEGNGTMATFAVPDDLAGELEHQRRVARAFQTSPVVQAALVDARTRTTMSVGEPA